MEFLGAIRDKDFALWLALAIFLLILLRYLILIDA